ncbi:MAG: ATP-dependent helicase [Actinomycetota bacterium]
MPPSQPWADQLNDAQRRAVVHPGGPLLVVAGAGSGKTKTLAARVAHLISEGTAPERILLLTFTRRAARDMLERAGRMSDYGAAGRVWGGTFHATANRLIRIHSAALGLTPDFTVMDQSDAADLMGLVRADLGLGDSTRRFPKKETLESIYSRVVNAATKLSEILERDYPWCADDTDGIRSVFSGYTQRKRNQKLLDYDDLLLFWKVLVGTSGAAHLVAGMFDHILVDEYQDTNALQADILRAMRAGNGNLMVVGDDAQAIYSFRSATARNILDFPQQWPDVTIVKLEQNYRSTKPILDASNEVMAAARERYTKDLWTIRHGDRKPMLTTCLDESQQCAAVCERVLDHREQGISLRSQAVLFRAAWHSDLLEIELRRRNIPYVKYGGLRFLEAAHVKDVLAILRILENPHDEIAWWRVLQLIEGIGPATARKIMERLGVTRSDISEVESLESILARLVDVPVFGGHDLEELRAVLAHCALGPDEGSQPPPATQIERIRRFYESIFHRRYDGVSSRLRDLEQLEQIAASFPTRTELLTELTLDPPTSTEDLAGPPHLDDDYLNLSTIHSAKGCEWNVVHILHVSDGMIPSDMALGDEEGLEEERRLLYVAMTRAKDALYLYFPLRYYHRRQGFGDAHTYAQLSRFVSEPVKALCDQSVHGVDVTRDEQVPVAGAVGSVDAVLEDLWRS